MQSCEPVFRSLLQAGMQMLMHDRACSNAQATLARTTQQLGESQLRNRGLQQLADALRHELHSLRGA